jgi:hypothetical protein
MILGLIALVMGWLAPIPSGVGWQKDNTAVVSFTSDPQTDCAILHNERPEDNEGVVACVNDIRGDKMILPNPCLFKTEHYARVACHELGHINGWRHEYR